MNIIIMRPAVCPLQCMGIFSTLLFASAQAAHVGVRHSARNRLVFLTYSYDVRSYAKLFPVIRL